MSLATISSQAGKPVSMAVGDMLRVGTVLVLVSRHTPSTGHDALRRHETVKPPSLAPATFGPAVLVDPEMQRLYALATRAAQSDIPILVLGETGVGKGCSPRPSTSARSVKGDRSCGSTAPRSRSRSWRASSSEA